MTKRLKAARQWPVLIGHRGARAFAPENTLEAFVKARDLGCDMIELDVHLSGDNHLVVHHDDDLRRCTNVAESFPGRDTYYVSDFKLAELKTLDAGSWFAEEILKPTSSRQTFLQGLSEQEQEQFIPNDDMRHYLGGAVRIPTFEEVLAFARDQSLLLNVEIKTIPRMYPGIADRVVKLIDSYSMSDKVLVSSFDHVQLSHVRRLSTTIATGILTSDRLTRIGSYAELLDADAYHPGCYGDYDSLGFTSATGTPDFGEIREYLDDGGLVFVWTCNDIRHMQSCSEAGVSGVITDYPNRFARVR